MPIDNTSTVVNAARAGKQLVTTVISATKEFFNELVHPNITIEIIAEVAAPRLDDLIEKNEANGLKYSAGKFKIEYVDDTHFTLAFEMYFKDADGKWYKSSGNSEPRDVELLDVGSWKTLQTLKSVEFPISAPAKEKASNENKPVEETAVLEPNETVEEAVEALTEPKVEQAKQEISLESLLKASKDRTKKDDDTKLNLDKD